MENLLPNVVITYLPAPLLGCAAGLFGALVGITHGCVERKQRWQPMLRAYYWSIVITSFLSLVLGIALLTFGLPPQDWYSLAQAGMIGLFLFGPIAFRSVYPAGVLKANTITT